ncbi:retropepsin-like aspartic protease [Reinekea sp. G2M2-21]|uniref:retropepsin-like aspartic protease n=1 Tax=Reinekea sp. G2M2-21 TaxID=2788942 RepID=UPI0018AC6756|nr:aspartyl protease family protein [Reinekea sp. G2M2-21]
MKINPINQTTRFNGSRFPQLHLGTVLAAALLPLLFMFSASANANSQPPVWLTEGPVLAQPSASFDVPLDVFATKLYVQVNIAGKERRFVVDTGSPSMIDKALAHELGLVSVGRSQGTDAHGAVIRSDIVQADLQIGGVEFRRVPMVTADFSSNPLTATFIGDGVLGSELLPLGAWQIDLQQSILRFRTETQQLPNLNRAKKLKLYQFGYPFSPIFDVTFAKKARSKAMLDTGAPTYFNLSPADLEGARKAGGVGQTRTGFGSAGSSLGGQAADAEQRQVMLNSLSLGNLKLGAVVSETRDGSPSLIGARMLAHYIVTLDSTAGVAYFKAFSDAPFAYSDFGFSLALGDHISIGLVWQNSAASAAGLKPGTVLTAINSVPVDASSEGLRHALTAMAGDEISLTWKGGAVTLTDKANLLINP